MPTQERLKRGARRILERVRTIPAFSRTINFFNDKYNEFILSSRPVQAIKQQYESHLAESGKRISELEQGVSGLEAQVTSLKEKARVYESQVLKLRGENIILLHQASESKRALDGEAERRRETLETARKLLDEIADAYREVTAEILTGKNRRVSPEIVEKYNLRDKIAEIAASYQQAFQQQQEELKWWRRNGFETALGIFIEKNPGVESLPFAYYTGGNLRRESQEFSKTIKRDRYNTLEELSQIFKLPRHAARKIYGAGCIKEGEHYVYSGKRPLSEKGPLVRVEFEAFGLPDEKGVLVYVTPISRFRAVSKKYKQMRELLNSYTNSIREFIEQSRQRVQLTPEIDAGPI